MDDFYSKLGMIKCSEIKHFSMKFPSEGVFWHCHFARNKLEASSQMFQAKRGQKTRKCEKCEILGYLL